MRRSTDERGVSAILIAACFMVFIGIAAIAIDLGAAFSERRGDQTAADLGALAGAQSILGGHQDMTNDALSYIRSNLTTTYTNAEWQAAWQGCTDPEKPGLNSSGFQFLSMREPTAWGTGVLDCMSIDPAGFLRVQLPNQVMETSFGQTLGVATIDTRADAIVRFAPRGMGGILPFGLLSGAGSGDQICLQTSPSGTAQPPCNSPSTGNFGVVEAPFYGNTELGTPQNCNGSPKNEVLAVNIAIGLDHLVLPKRPADPARNDNCPQIATGVPPNSLFMQTGNPQGSAEGIATGPVNLGKTARLKQGANSKTGVHGHNLDNKPLWEYLNPAISSPSICSPSTFIATVPAIDYDLDGTLDPEKSWQHMQACLAAYSLVPPGQPLFVDTIAQSPRFAYAPQFYENSWPSGVSAPRTIKRFVAIWIQGTWWKKGGAYDAFHPGDGISHTAGGSWDLTQVSGFYLGDSMLPNDLKGATVAGLSSLNPFKPQLYR